MSFQWSKACSAKCVLHNFHAGNRVIRSLKPPVFGWNSTFYSLMIKNRNCGWSLWYGLRNLPWLCVNWCFPLMVKDKPEKLKTVLCGSRWVSKTPVVSGFYKKCMSWLELEICYANLKLFVIMQRFLGTWSEDKDGKNCKWSFFTKHGITLKKFIITCIKEEHFLFAIYNLLGKPLLYTHKYGERKFMLNCTISGRSWRNLRS